MDCVTLQIVFRGDWQVQPQLKVQGGFNLRPTLDVSVFAMCRIFCKVPTIVFFAGFQKKVERQN